MPDLNEAAPKDIESEMRDMFTAAEGTVQQEAAPQETPAPEATATPEPASDGRARDETGKFVAKTEAAPEKQPKATQTPQTEKQPAQQTPEQAQVQQPAGQPENQPVRPPSSWSASAKAEFDKLSPVIQKEVMRREEDFHKGIEQYRQGHAQAQEFMQVINPYMPLIQAEGGTPVAAVQSLLNTAYQIRQNPAGTIAALAQQFGVDLSQFAQQQESQDPNIMALQREIQGLKAQLGQGQQYQQQQIAQQQAAVDQQAGAELQAFANDPKNLYLDNVRADMAVLLKEGRARDLQDAYDKACWQNPEVRSILLQQQAAAAESKRIEEAKLKAANAKRAVGIDVKGQGSDSVGDRTMGLEDELRQHLLSTST